MANVCDCLYARNKFFGLEIVLCIEEINVASTFVVSWPCYKVPPKVIML